MIRKHRVLFLIVILAFFLRLPLLNSSFWLDEAAQVFESNRSFFEVDDLDLVFHPPLYHYIVYGFLFISKAEWWLRLTSLISGVATIGLLYHLLRQTISNRAAVIGSLLLATSPFHVFYSQELRPYAWSALIALVTWGALQSWVSEHSSKKRLSFWLWIFSSVLSLYSLYLLPFNTLAQLVYIFVKHRVLMRQAVFGLLVGALGFLPWTPHLYRQLSIGNQWSHQLPGWISIVSTPNLISIPLVLAKFFTGSVELKTLGFSKVFFAAAILIGMASLAVCWKKPKAKLFVYWFIVPLVLLWIFSWVIPVIQPKRLLFLLPAFLACIATATDVLWRYRLVRLALVFILVLQTLSLYLYWTVSRYQREPWREIVATVEQDCEGSCAALFTFDTPFAPWRLYTTGKVAAIATGTLVTQTPSDVSGQLEQARTYETLYVFDYLSDITDSKRILRSELGQQGYKETRLMDGGSIGFIRIFRNTRE